MQMKMRSLIRFESGKMFPQKPFSTARMLGKIVFVNKGSEIAFESCLPAIEVGAVFRNLYCRKATLFGGPALTVWVLFVNLMRWKTVDV